MQQSFLQNKATAQECCSYFGIELPGCLTKQKQDKFLSQQNQQQQQQQ